MRMFIILFIFLTFTGQLAHAIGQDKHIIDVEDLITRHSINCQDIALSATALIPGYHQDNKTDTLQALLHYWESTCGITEPMMRFAILWQIETNTFNEDWLPERLPGKLLDYREAIESEEPVHDYFHFDEWEYHAMDEGYADFTTQMAKSLKDYDDLAPIETFFITYYSNDFDKAMSLLENDTLEDTRLDSLYEDYAKEVRPRGYTHAGFYFGFWNPSGSLDALGVHPQVGLVIDAVRDRALYGLSFRLGFGNTTRPYETEIGGSYVSTTDFLQVQAGVHAGVDLLSSANYSLFIRGGAAYDAIDPKSQAHRDAGYQDNISTLNVNAGLAFHRRFERGNLFSIMVNYNLLNYNNPGRTDLSGNVLTFGVAYGIMTRDFESESR